MGKHLMIRNIIQRNVIWELWNYVEYIIVKNLTVGKEGSEGDYNRK